ncbi:MAG: M48 family metalloprotease [Syntrophaceae bacterium]|nr:M48 family metalloprotease [Syntrophaceae bacterium]
MKNHKGSIRVMMVWSLFLAALLFFGTVPAQAEFTTDDEKRIGREFYEKLESNNVLLQDKRMNDYISQVGSRVLSSVKTPLFDYRFFIVKSSAINAFATPGGYIYVNRGLIALADTEAELAAVLGHEIGHANARHIASMVNKATKVNLATLAAVIAGAFLGGGGDLSAALMSFSLATSETLSLKYSRDNEEEADRLGLSYLVKAGYRGDAVLSLLRLMRKYEFYSKTVPSYFMTHPGTDERIRYVDGLLQTTYANSGGKDEVVGHFRRIKMVMMTAGPNVESKIKYFEDEVQKNPSDVDSLYGLGVVQARKGIYRESIETLQKALLMAPGDKEILRDIGVDYYKLGQYPQAIDYLSRAQKIDDKDIKTLAYLGNSYEAMGFYEKALEYYRALERTDLDDEEIYYSMGMAYGKLKAMGDSHYYFGIYFKKQNKNDTALFHFKEALKYFTINDLRYQNIEREIRILSNESASKKKRNDTESTKSDLKRRSRF